MATGYDCKLNEAMLEGREWDPDEGSLPCPPRDCAGDTGGCGFSYAYDDDRYDNDDWHYDDCEDCYPDYVAPSPYARRDDDYGGPDYDFMPFDEMAEAAQYSREAREACAFWGVNW